MMAKIRQTERKQYLAGRAFTIVELLVVVAIIALLAALLLTSLAAAKETVYQTQCAGNLKQWGIALAAFTIDNQDKLPSLPYQDSSGNLTGANDLAWMPASFNTGFFPDYLVKNRPGSHGNERSKIDVLYCPTDQFHRMMDANPPAGYQTNLIGYNYLTGRDAAGGLTVDYGSDGLGGWVTNRVKPGGPFRLAPMMADRLQYNLRNQSWKDNYYGSIVSMGVHLNHAGIPRGGNFLYEDSRVDWQKFIWNQPPLTSRGIGIGCQSPGASPLSISGTYLEYYRPAEVTGTGPW